MQKTAELEWNEAGVPVSTRFDDPYFSLEDGLAETRHVFLGGNDLPDRFRDGFHIAELGFGTGLNFLTALKAFRQAGVPGRLHFTSFEAYPMSIADIARALQRYRELPLGDLLSCKTLNGGLSGDDFDLEVHIADARVALPAWSGSADAWFLDGFSPAKNSELWGADLMKSVADHTRPGGSFATYTAAGHVRRALEAAGFEVERVPGYGRKRHMTRGKLR